MAQTIRIAIFIHYNPSFGKLAICQNADT